MAERELRLALALNGGISLAVWMGGVVDELLRFCCKAGPYEEVLPGCSARVDVIGGASAGGLNGVFLALGLVYGHEDLTVLRDLWIDSGSFERLFRSPYASPAPSLLKGDDYFLEELQKAIRQLMTGGQAKDADKVPIDLRMTVTSLTGEPRAIPDDFGGVIPDVRHDVQLHFERGRTSRDDFSDPNDSQRELVVRRLARASRSSASFPGAFEPSFASVSGDDGIFIVGEHAQGFRHDRFVVDGGVLVNLPVNAVVDAIFDQPARGPVSRVLGTVVPDPSLPRTAKPDEKKDPPGIGSVIASSVVGIPRQQSVARFLDEVTQHNVGVRIARAARDRMMQDVAPDDLAAFALKVYEAYRAGRIKGSRAQFADHLAREIGVAWPAGPSVARRSAEAAFTMALDGGSLPWVPEPGKELPVSGWGVSAITRAAALLIQLLARLHDKDGPDTGELKRRVHDVRRDAATIRPVWRTIGIDVAESLISRGAIASTEERAELLGTPCLVPATRAALDNWPRPPDSRSRLDELFRNLGEICAEMVRDIPSDTGDEMLERLSSELGGDAASPETCQRWLLALEVVQHTFVGFEERVDQKVELLQITSTRKVAVDPLERTGAGQKLGGTELGHFGGFLKRSWRANDWMWGRLDAAAFLGDLLDDAQVAKRAQFAILREELPVVAAQVDVDLDVGAEPGSLGRSFRDIWRERVSHRGGAGNLGETDLREMLGSCRVGDETVAEEVGSELGARTLASALAAGANTFVDASPPALRNIGRLVRWLALVAWGIARTGGSRRPIGSAFVGAIYGLGLAGAATTLFTDVDLGPLAVPAWLVLIAAVLLAVGRAPAIVLPTIVIGVVPGLLHALPEERWSWWPWAWWRLQQKWIAAVAFITAALVVGGLREWRWARRFTTWLTRVHRRRNEEMALIAKVLD